MDEKNSTKVNILNEEKILAHLLRTPDDLDLIGASGWFRTPNLGLLYFNLRKYTDTLSDKTQYTLSNLSNHIRSYNKDFPISIIEQLLRKHKQIDDIHEAIKILENDFIRWHSIREVVTKYMENLNNEGEGALYDTERVISSLTILVNRVKINKEDSLLTFKDIRPTYGKILESRLTTGKRTIGYDGLDKYITKPLEPEQYTIVFGATGSGKSVFLKNIEHRLMKQNVCVLSINLEMTPASSFDTLVSIESGLSVLDLQLHNKSPEMFNRIKEGYDGLEKSPNYLFYTSSYHTTMNFYDVDSLILRAKDKFRKAGVLPDDEYIVVTIDLLSDVKDFFDETPESIAKGIKRLDSVVKKHKCHAICVVQANENKFRGNFKLFQKPEDVDNYTLTLEDIFGSSAYAKKSRLILSIWRPNFMKLRFFRNHEHIAQWKGNIEEDIIVSALKQTEGGLFSEKLVFNQNNLRIEDFGTEDKSSI